MRAYGKLNPRLYTGQLGMGMRIAAQGSGDPYLQALAPYLISGPHSNMIGLYHLPAVYVQANLNWPIEEVRRCIEWFVDRGFILYDQASEHVLVVESWRIELGRDGDLKPDDNRRYGVAELLRPIIRSPLVAFFLSRYPGTRAALVGLLPVHDIAPSTGPYIAPAIAPPDSPSTGGLSRARDARASGAGTGAGTGAEEGNGVCPAPAQTPITGPTSRVVLVFPTTGKGPKEWELTEQKLAEYQGDYPHLDVLGCFRRARSWCANNPKDRKTASGMPRFLTNWLNREVDQPRGRHAQPNFSPSRSSRIGVDTPTEDAESRRKRWRVGG